MSKIPSNQDNETMSICVFIKRCKRSRVLFEPSLGVLGFFFVGLCLICSFFFMDYNSVAKRYGLSGQTNRFRWLGLEADKDDLRKFNFLEEKGNGCDVFDGDWVWDETYPLYESKDCSFLDQGFRCGENGRPDLLYTKWRWQPKSCNLPRFDAKLMLEKLRNRRLVFVGDSIGRNQWESLLCLLSSVIQNKSSIYEVNGSPITKHKGFLVFKFEDFNCTVEYYKSPFLVVQTRPPTSSPEKVKMVLKLDTMDWTSVKWRDADVLIFNTGHWWSYEKTIRGGCYFQEGEKVKLGMSVDDAYKKSIETVLKWTRNEVNTNKTRVYFRTFAPIHFRGGDWRTGGSCHLETLPELGDSLVQSETWKQFKIMADVLRSMQNTSKPMRVEMLNITGMTGRRKDGHSSLYYLGSGSGPAALHRQDCSHWCLPGVPDTWNELLYAVFMKQGAEAYAAKVNVSNFVASPS